MCDKHNELDGHFLHDVIIIGAGPCGLAVAARLCEHTPSALFTDVEHERYHWIQKHGHKGNIKSKAGRNADEGKRRTDKTDLSSPRISRSPYSTLVLDSSASSWMARWNSLFERFGISHLRSPMFFHVDPLDRDGLRAFAHEQDRQAELKELRDCVGKEVSKHKRKKRMSSAQTGARASLEIDERDRKDYYVAPQSLFMDHCDCVVDRYGLGQGLIRQENVLDIEFGQTNAISPLDEIFILRTDKGVHHARTVVLAIGAGSSPIIPPQIPQLPHPGVCHSNAISVFPSRNVKTKIEAGAPSNVLVVGGGLTSAQLDDLAIRHGISKVWHVMRGNCKGKQEQQYSVMLLIPAVVKPFDVDLTWMGKFKNHEKATFWSADSDEERLTLIREARNGGSITPEYRKTLRRHTQAGMLSLHTNTQISSAAFCNETETWRVELEPPIENLPDIDYIYLATGMETNFSKMKFLQTMNKQYPLHGHGGFPCINDDLMWRDDVPLFVTGKLASLRLGPGAGNLEGARMGAERVVWGLRDVLGSPSGGDCSEDDEAWSYYTGVGSRFETLADTIDN